METSKFEIQVFFQVLNSNSRVFHFWRKFQTFSRSGKVNDKISGFQGFPGRVGTLVLISKTACSGDVKPRISK